MNPPSAILHPDDGDPGSDAPTPGRGMRALVATAMAHHHQMADTLAKLIASHRRPDVGIYSNGMWNPPRTRAGCAS